MKRLLGALIGENIACPSNRPLQILFG